MSNWQWVDKLRRYRDLDTGKFVSKAQVDQWVSQAITASGDRARTIGQLLIDGKIDVGTWQARFREEIKRVYVQEYLAGKGGTGKFTKADAGRLGNMLRDQYKYLDRFAQDVAKGKLTPGQMLARMNLYIKSAGEAYERAKAATRGIPLEGLPAFPRDGDSCLGGTNCGCEWEFEEAKNDEGKVVGWNAFWRLGPTEHCELCLQHAVEWNPFYLEGA